jgi:glycogen(starch) synthase
VRALIISASYAPVLGGLQTVVHQLARELGRGGHAVRVVTNRYPRSLPSHKVIDGVPVERWPFLNSSADALRDGRLDLALAGAYYRWASFVRLSRLVAEFKPDVVNVHFPESRLAGVLRVRGAHPFRLVVSLHGDEVERCFRNGSQRQTHSLRTFLRTADAVTACSKYLLDRATAVEPSIAGKSSVIHNGVDPARFEESTAHARPRPYVLALGRYTYKKGFDLLLDAFAALAAKFPDVDLILAGDGEEHQRLTRQCAALGLQRRVEFYGRATATEVIQLLNGCRVAVIPSREEPFGIVALEAVLAGRPTVATRVGGLPELVAALGVGSSDETPAVRWTDPEPRGLQRALADALAQTGLPQPAPAAAAFSLEKMSAAYIRVLQYGSQNTSADALCMRAS